MRQIRRVRNEWLITVTEVLAKNRVANNDLNFYLFRCQNCDRRNYERTNFKPAQTITEQIYCYLTFIVIYIPVLYNAEPLADHK